MKSLLQTGEQLRPSLGGPAGWSAGAQRGEGGLEAGGGGGEGRAAALKGRNLV